MVGCLGLYLVYAYNSIFINTIVIYIYIYIVCDDIDQEMSDGICQNNMRKIAILLMTKVEALLEATRVFYYSSRLPFRIVCKLII